MTINSISAEHKLELDCKTDECLYLDEWLLIQNRLTSYKSRYSNDKSFDFIIPLMVLLFLGVVYVLSLRDDAGYVSFILIGITAVIMIYWVRVLKKMTKDSQPQYVPKESETKNWVYDLIKGDNEIVFVAEVPGQKNR
ncbi:hypothetical protein DYY67_1560 [Candidatus Nitrosotalea sp. TS]|nr:hypothetical protein [Candidatus Nitrosotalea sp. TS]